METNFCLSFVPDFFLFSLYFIFSAMQLYITSCGHWESRDSSCYISTVISTSLKLNTPKASEIASKPTHTTDTHTHTAQSGKPITQNILHENQNQWQNYWTQTWRITNGSKSRWEFNIFNSELILSKFWIWNVFHQLQSRNGRYTWDIVCDECIKAAQNN